MAYFLFYYLYQVIINVDKKIKRNKLKKCKI